MEESTCPISIVNNCSCIKQDLLNSDTRERKKNSILFGFFNLGKSQSLNLQTNKKKLKRSSWITKLNCTKTDNIDNSEVTSQSDCQCTHYQEADEKASISVEVEDMSASNVVEAANEEVIAVVQEPVEVEASVQEEVSAQEVVGAEEAAVNVVAAPSESSNSIYNGGFYSNSSGNIVLTGRFLDVEWIRSHVEDCDEAARLQRAREIEQGVEAPPNFRPMRRIQLIYSDADPDSNQVPRYLQLVCPSNISIEALHAFFQNRITLKPCPLDTVRGCHTQIDFIHCLVPDLHILTNCSFYWGKMDRYEAERLLEGKTEGTFLLRDSAQEDFLFSVSFRKYNRSLHARIEQWNHKFSFDSHDPGVYTSDTVCGLIEHYKDPSSCMFFEPMLTWPLNRKFTFSLQHLCRTAIVSRLTYDDISTLKLPKSLKTYLKEYHYRQKVRVERFDDDVQFLDLRSVPP